MCETSQRFLSNLDLEGQRAHDLVELLPHFYTDHCLLDSCGLCATYHGCDQCAWQHCVSNCNLALHSLDQLLFARYFLAQGR